MLESIGRLRDYILCALSLGNTPQDKFSILWQETKNIRVRLHLEEHHPNKIYTLNTIYGPLYFRDNFGDITNLVNLFYRQVYQIQTVTSPGVIIDLGANIGLAAAWFAYHNPEHPIYCFEPLADNASLIKFNCPKAEVNRWPSEPKRVKLIYK